ncbi:Pol polyprotein [Cacatuid alphaherpesvirus 2]|uniref:dUTP diphosphatase n=1 Tax=Cacatuid alphaherpesvirus 2 TaxID=2604840 RepID=A0A5B9QZY5_9ALPH|nr:Pol polyprotein [Cacatuid alphaherpesvirus 2]QEG54071.1 Pol polyprotein [Cacatuid alphaherpesvirus 2]
MAAKKEALIEIGNGWSASGLGTLRCVITNEEEVYAKSRVDTPVLKLDSNVRTTMPPGYGIIIFGTAKNSKSVWEIVPGLIDSDYTGAISLLLVKIDEDAAPGNAGGGITPFPQGCVNARMMVIKLVPNEIMSGCGIGDLQRLPLKAFNTSFRGDEEILGKGFDHCMEALVSIYPDTPHAQLDCPMFFGCTGCKCFYRRINTGIEERGIEESSGEDNVYILQGSTYESVNRFSAKEDVKFVAMYGKWLLVGLSQCSVEPVSVELKNDTSIPAALLPFFDVFGMKRSEDAGYDIKAPDSFTMPPGGSARIILKQKLHMGDGRAAYIVGRSSMNLKGLLLKPERVFDEEWISFMLTNIRSTAYHVSKNDRIAQLVAIEGKIDLMEGKDALQWREVLSVREENKNSVRGEKGFGSSGI